MYCKYFVNFKIGGKHDNSTKKVGLWLDRIVVERGESWRRINCRDKDVGTLYVMAEN